MCIYSLLYPPLLTKCAFTLQHQLHSVTVPSRPHHHSDKLHCHRESHFPTSPSAVKKAKKQPLPFSVLCCSAPHRSTSFYPLDLSSVCHCPLSCYFKTNLPSHSIIHWAELDQLASSADLHQIPVCLFPQITPATIQPRAHGKKGGETQEDLNRWLLCMPELTLNTN